MVPVVEFHTVMSGGGHTPYWHCRHDKTCQGGGSERSRKGDSIPSLLSSESCVYAVSWAAFSRASAQLALAASRARKGITSFGLLTPSTPRRRPPWP